MSSYFLMSLPDGAGDEASQNWEAAIWDREEAPFAVSDPFSEPDQTPRDGKAV